MERVKKDRFWTIFLIVIALCALGLILLVLLPPPASTIRQTQLPPAPFPEAAPVQATSTAPVDPLSGRAPDLPYTLASPASFSEWYTPWGTSSYDDGVVLLGSGRAGSAGGLYVFRRGMSFTDVRFETVAERGTADSLSLVGRYAKDGSHVACLFSPHDGYAALYHVAPEARRIGETTTPTSSPAHLAIEIRGISVRCLLNGEVALEADIPEIPSSGTVGLETWGEAGASYTVRDISIRETGLIASE